MTINTDYHIHTALCKHAVGEMEEYVEQALQSGLEEIAFTDHIPLPDNFDIEHRMHFDELDYYFKSISDLNTTYPEISILAGIEADYYPGFEDYLDHLLSQYPFDIVLMAVHFIKGWPDGNWVFHFDFPDRSVPEVYADYLNALKSGIQTGLFDVVAHLDLIKKAGCPLIKENRDTLNMIFDEIKKSEMVIEINTSGKRKSISDYFPSPDIWRMIEQAGIPITVGSDAHNPAQVGFEFATLAKQLPMTPVRFKNRQIIQTQPSKPVAKEY